ncbi:MAG: hypothetical protein K0Q66_204 [Chitinophagaceae bacterium]|nr:hypothetical protein [Chitinophagaceae bacterium]
MEITHDRVPYRLLVKRVFNSSNSEITFHCWAPEDSSRAKELLKGDIIKFKWDDTAAELQPFAETPVADSLKRAIHEHFCMERA